MPTKRAFDSSFGISPKDVKRRRKTESATEGPTPADLTEKLRIYSQAHNAVEARVFALEKLARPYQEFERKTRRGIHLMQQVREEVTSNHVEAMNEVDQAIEVAKAEYSRHVKSIATSCVELSTNKLCLTLIKRLADGDQISKVNLERLRELVGRAEQAEQVIQGCEQARVLPSPSTDGEEVVSSAVKSFIPSSGAGPRITIRGPNIEHGQAAAEHDDDKIPPVIRRSACKEVSSTPHDRDSQEAGERTSRTRRGSKRDSGKSALPGQSTHKRDDNGAEDADCILNAPRKSACSQEASKRPKQNSEDYHEDEDEEDGGRSPAIRRKSGRVPRPKCKVDFGFVTWNEAKEYKKRHRKR